MKSIKEWNKKGNVIGMIIVGLLVVGIGFGIFAWTSQRQIGEGGGGPDKPTGGCPDTGLNSVAISLVNPLNSTGFEDYNATLVLLGDDGDKITVTSTTGATTNMICGETYTGKIIGTSGNQGDGTVIVSTSQGKIVDGNVVFTVPNKAQMSIDLKAEQVGEFTIRAFDIINDGFMENLGFSENEKSYLDQDGIEYESVTNNTNTSVGSGGEFHVKQFLRANLTDVAINDRGILVLVDARAATWQEPTILINGATATEATGELTNNERIAYSDYEYVYIIPSSTRGVTNKEIVVDMQIFALSGTDPDATTADNIDIDYAVRTNYQSTTDASVVKVGAVKDDSAKTQILKLFNTKFGIA